MNTYHIDDFFYNTGPYDTTLLDLYQPFCSGLHVLIRKQQQQ